jgi:signal recognition particle subunit SRP19
LKDYKKIVLWLDYFNSSNSRKQGRRVSLDKAVREPTLEELVESAKRLGFNPEPSRAKYPARMYQNSGYISIEKKKTQGKQKAINDIARVLSQVRGERQESVRNASAPHSPHPSQTSIPKKH